MASLHLLLLLVTLLCSVSAQSKISPFSTNSVAFPLKTQKTPLALNAKPASALSFHHNVTLTVTLTVGTPPQPVSMVLDTGSELSWLHCKRTPNINQIFDPARSTSYAPVPCSSSMCTIRTRDFSVPASCDAEKLCHTMIAYADASSIEGNLALETFHISGSAIPGMGFGCMSTGSSGTAEEDAKTTGLLGMNRGSLSFVTQMGYPKFSYCISGQDSSGVLLLGEVDTTSWLKPLRYTPLVQVSDPLPYFDRVAYSVHLVGIKVGTKVLPLQKSVLELDHTGAGQTMVDSGTQFSFLLGPVYTVLRNEFKAQTTGFLRPLNDPNYMFQDTMDLCFLVPLAQMALPPLPTVTLMFQGAEMTVSGERLLYRVPGGVKGSDAIHCFTFGNSDLLGIEAYVIGHHHQQDMWMEFDLAQSRVGLAEVRCDLASQKLGVGQKK
ncbi:Glutathione gamma-glutamylcysteinyltransferase 1 [Dionaea muscipula]